VVPKVSTHKEPLINSGQVWWWVYFRVQGVAWYTKREFYNHPCRKNRNGAIGL